MIGAMTPDELLARLLSRDGLMLVIDKPAGLPVHRGPKGGESLEDHFGALRFGLPRAPALAHRLDRETSGCLVLGRHRKALATLGRLFKTGAVGKCYWAVVGGGPVEDEGVIDLPLGRRDESRGWWMKPDPAGQEAVTKWKVLGRGQWGAPKPAQNSEHDVEGRRASSVPSPLAGEGQGEGWRQTLALGATPLPTPPPPPGRSRPSSTGYGGREPGRRAATESVPRAVAAQHLSWLALEPVTGRTHQLRVHCAARGFPIVGDTIYGSAPRTGGPPLHLHSREIIVPLYKNR